MTSTIEMPDANHSLYYESQGVAHRRDFFQSLRVTTRQEYRLENARQTRIRYRLQTVEDLRIPSITTDLSCP